MNSSWIREIPNSPSIVHLYDTKLNKNVETKIKEFLLKIDTSDAISLAEVPLGASSSQSNATTIFLDNTNRMKFNFNRLIKNIIYVEVEEFIVPSLEYLVPTKYLIPDIKDTVTDIQNEKNVAGDLPWQLTPLNYFTTYTGNALAQYGYISNIVIPSSNTSPGTITTLVSQGQTMTGATSGATGRIESLYVNSDETIQKVFYTSLNTHNFIQSEVINITDSSGAAITSWLALHDSMISNDDEIRQTFVALDNNQNLPGYNTWPPETSNGSVIVRNYDQYKSYSIASTSRTIEEVTLNTEGSVASTDFMTIKTNGPHFMNNGDTVCFTGSPNAVLSGCFTANTAISLTAPNEPDRPQFFSIETKPTGTLTDATYWNGVATKAKIDASFISDQVINGFGDMKTRISQDFKNRRISVRIQEFGDFYANNINVKQGTNFLPTSASIEQMLTTTNYEVETSIHYGFRKTFITPINLNSLTLDFFTNEGQKLILNDVLFGPIGNKKDKMSITLKIRTLIEDTKDLQTEVSTVPYANFNTN